MSEPAPPVLVCLPCAVDTHEDCEGKAGELEGVPVACGCDCEAEMATQP